MALQKNDELNFYERYFEEAPLSNDEKRKRIDLAEELEILFLYLFVAIDEPGIEKKIAEKYQEIVTKHMGMDNTPAYIVSLSQDCVNEVARATRENIDTEYYTSKERAANIGADQAHNIFEYKDYTDAVKQGKTRKIWVSMLLKNTRPAHWDAHGQEVGIFQKFHVGDSDFDFPKDLKYNPSAEQVVNCVCHCKYL